MPLLPPNIGQSSSPHMGAEAGPDGASTVLPYHNTAAPLHLPHASRPLPPPLLVPLITQPLARSSACPSHCSFPPSLSPSTAILSRCSNFSELAPEFAQTCPRHLSPPSVILGSSNLSPPPSQPKPPTQALSSCTVPDPSASCREPLRVCRTVNPHPTEVLFCFKTAFLSRSCCAIIAAIRRPH